MLASFAWTGEKFPRRFCLLLLSFLIEDLGLPQLWASRHNLQLGTKPSLFQ
jgi:hypothetical protein